MEVNSEPHVIAVVAPGKHHIVPYENGATLAPGPVLTLPVLGNEPRFLCRPVRSPATIPTSIF
jgi:hypothetical protein